ncbi:MAG TPA: SAM-dependent methyltransferase [Mycobacteriales bacterium]|nr:SAM-dependent methyltransferase [Mycobacteriales bacterium]
MERPNWMPADLDVDRPNAARMYDYFLGGSHNLAADREIARQITDQVPDIPLIAHANRAFLRRAVKFCVDAGIRQFLDLGSGIPTVGNVHEVAQRSAPDCRVVYVDFEPVAVAHSRVMLAGNDQVTVLPADIREPDRILTDPRLLELLDLSQPVGLLMVSVLPFIADADDPVRLVARYRDALTAGSYLALSHGCAESRPEDVEKVYRFYRRTTTPVVVRSRVEIEKMFEGFELVEPGLVYVQEWRPDWLGEVEDHPERSGMCAGVGRKP